MNGNNSKPTPQSKARKSRPKLEKRIRVLEQPTADTHGWGAISIQVGKKVDAYLVRFIPTDFGAGAIGFELEKLDADLNPAEVYHVLLNGQHSTCDCKGGEHHGHCKHRDELEALRQAGQLRPYRSAGDMAANDPTGYADHMASLTRDEYPDEPPQLPHWSDWSPDDDGPDTAA